MDIANIITCIDNAIEQNNKWYELLVDIEVGFKETEKHNKILALLPKKHKEHLQKCIENAIIFNSEFPKARENGKVRHDKKLQQ